MWKAVLLAVLFPIVILLLFCVYLFSASQTNEMVEQDTDIEYDYDVEGYPYWYYIPGYGYIFYY